jgi:CHAD domain-containing protein
MKTAKAAPTPHGSSKLVPAGTWLHGLLMKIALRAQADGAWMADSPELAIHRLRKRMKKLQSLLKLAESVQGEEAIESVRARIREVKDALASQRDADVVSALGAELGVVRAGKRRAMPDAKLLKTCLSELVDSTGRMNLSALTWDAVTTSHLKTCRYARKSWKKAQRHPTEKMLHSWRKRVKDQYHQALALHPWLGQSGRLRCMRQLGSMLGKCHDLDLFESTLGHSKGGNKLRHKLGCRRRKLARRIFRRAERVFDGSLSKARDRFQERLPVHRL